MGVLDRVNLHPVRTMADAADFLEWLFHRRRDVLGLDTESGGLDHIRHRLRFVQFGDLTDGWAVPWERWSGLIIEALLKYEGPLVFHNAPHDVKFLVHNAPELIPWPWDRTNDTLTVAHLIDPLRSKSLKGFAGMHIDMSAALAQKTLEHAMAINKWTWDTVPLWFKDYWGYAAMDPVLAAYIFDKYKGETINGAPREAYALEMGSLRVVTGMMLKGALVDLDYCERQTNVLGDWTNQMMIWLAENYKIKSVDSGAQLDQAFHDLGVTVPLSYTDGGKQSYAKAVLEQIDHDLARHVLDVRHVNKQLGPYFRNFQRMADSNDRVHPLIWSMGTRTGRQTVVEPALQTLPKKDPTIRRAFIAAPGNVLISIDADQIEARLAADFSKDPGLIKAFLSPDDFFVVLARDIFQDQTLRKDDQRRDLAKSTTYGRIYGAMPLRMSITAGVPLGQMEEFVLMFDQRFPGISRLQKSIMDRAHQRKINEGMAYVITPLGRKLACDPGFEYALLNYRIQGHAAEILKRCMVELDALGFGQYMILPVHDEILMEVPVELAEEVLRLALSIMNDPSSYAVPITWSGEILDKNWGQKYEQAAA